MSHLPQSQDMWFREDLSAFRPQNRRLGGSEGSRGRRSSSCTRTHGRGAHELEVDPAPFRLSCPYTAVQGFSSVAGVTVPDHQGKLWCRSEGEETPWRAPVFLSCSEALVRGSWTTQYWQDYR